MKFIKIIEAAFKNRRGSIMIAIIITISILAIIGTALIALNTSSNISHIQSALSSKALYLAESGFRFIENEHKNDVNISTLVGKDIEITGEKGHSFKLSMVPYIFRTLSSTDKIIVETRAKNIEYFFKEDGCTPPDLNPTVSKGLLKVFGTEGFYSYDSSSAETIASKTIKITFTGSELKGQAPIPAGKMAFLCATTSKIESDMTLADGYETWPKKNGHFMAYNSSHKTIQEKTFSYKLRTGNILSGISEFNLVTGEHEALSEEYDTIYITLNPFFKIGSAGTAGAFTQEASFLVPVSIKGLLTAETKIAKSSSVDNKDELNKMLKDEFGNFNVEKPKRKPGIEEFEVEEAIKPNKQKKIKERSWLTLIKCDDSIEVALSSINWKNQNIDLHRLRESTGGYLSYDLQAKFAVLQNDKFNESSNQDSMRWAGFHFRIPNRNNNYINGYGVAFIKRCSKQDNECNGIPKELTYKSHCGPQERSAIIVYKMVNGKFKTIAYRSMYHNNTKEYIDRGDKSDCKTRCNEGPDLVQSRRIVDHLACRADGHFSDYSSSNISANSRWLNLWPTLAVRVIEAASIKIKRDATCNGREILRDGDIVYFESAATKDSTPVKGSATVRGNPIRVPASGLWDHEAPDFNDVYYKGILLLNDIKDSEGNKFEKSIFPGDVIITINGKRYAIGDQDTFRKRDNYIRVYIGDNEELDGKQRGGDNVPNNHIALKDYYECDFNKSQWIPSSLNRRLRHEHYIKAVHGADGKTLDDIMKWPEDIIYGKFNNETAKTSCTSSIARATPINPTIGLLAKKSAKQTEATHGGIWDGIESDYFSIISMDTPRKLGSDNDKQPCRTDVGCTKFGNPDPAKYSTAQTYLISSADEGGLTIIRDSQWTTENYDSETEPPEAGIFIGSELAGYTYIDDIGVRVYTGAANTKNIFYPAVQSAF